MIRYLVPEHTHTSEDGDVRHRHIDGHMSHFHGVTSTAGKLGKGGGTYGKPEAFLHTVQEESRTTYSEFVPVSTWRVSGDWLVISVVRGSLHRHQGRILLISPSTVDWIDEDLIPVDVDDTLTDVIL